MSEMVERVAIAICGIGREEWGEPEFERYQYIYLSRARKAIAAMREPTDAMYWAGEDKLDVNAKGVWQAMIDEALK